MASSFLLASSFFSSFFLSNISSESTYFAIPLQRKRNPNSVFLNQNGSKTLQFTCKIKYFILFFQQPYFITLSLQTEWYGDAMLARMTDITTSIIQKRSSQSWQQHQRISSALSLVNLSYFSSSLFHSFRFAKPEN